MLIRTGDRALNLPIVAGLLVAQVAPGSSPSAAPSGATTTTIDSSVVWLLALKRWYNSLTLTSPEALPSWNALWFWLGGIGALLAMAVVAQGPVRAIAQFLDLLGLSRLITAGLGRLRRSSRLVAILLAATVVSWTAWQTPLHNRAEKKQELGLLLNSKSRTEFSIEQGILASITPVRDLLDMGDTLVLLVGAAALIFKFSADRWGRFDNSEVAGRGSSGGWTTACWGAAGLYAMYRMAGLIYDIEGLPPLGGCLFVEVALVPVLMLLCDGILLAWVVAELRGVHVGDEEEGFDVAAAITLVPGAILACLFAIPARYAAMAAGLAQFHHITPKPGVTSWPLILLRGWGLIGLQAGAITMIGLIAGLAASNGTWLGTIRGYGRVLKAEGGRLAGLIVLTGLGVGITSAVAYYGVLAMPAQPWVLLAADSYAHYASLPIGLIGVAALVELGARSAIVSQGDPFVFVEVGEKA